MLSQIADRLEPISEPISDDQVMSALKYAVRCAGPNMEWPDEITFKQLAHDLNSILKSGGS